jgi:hypothetical protein
MVTAPIVLLIAVTTAPEGGALMKEAAAACIQTLPVGATTVVRQVATLPDDAEIGADAAAIGATATVIVTWRDTDRLVSDVRVLMPSAAQGPAHTTTRTIVFSARDLPAERGRALGLIIGSILDEAWGPGMSPRSEAADRRSAPAVVASIDAEVPAPIGPLPGEAPPAPPNWAIEASVITAVDRQVDLDDTIGGMIAVRRTIRSHWTARVGLGLRVVDLDGADASARTTLAELGLVWASDGFGRPAGLGFGARIDVLGTHEAIKRSTGDDSEFEDLWSLGGDILGQFGLGLSAETTLLLSTGLEGVLTGASLAEPDRATAEIPRDRLIFELGVLSRF